MLTFKTVLHPTDFSESSSYAFRMACMLASEHGGRVIVLHVAVPPPTLATIEGVMIPEPALDEEALREKLETIRAGAEVPVEHALIVSNDPVGEILACAKESPCDLIVMG